MKKLISHSSIRLSAEDLRKLSYLKKELGENTNQIIRIALGLLYMYHFDKGKTSEN